MTDAAKPEVLVTNFNPRYTGVSSTTRNVLRQTLADGVKAQLVGVPLPDCPAPVTRAEAIRLSRTPPPGRPFTIWHVRRDPEMQVALFARDILRLPIRIVFTSAAKHRHSFWPRWLISRMDAVIATSDEAAALVPHVRVTAPHGVDCTLWHPAEDRAAAWRATGYPGDYGIGVMGRIRPEKGSDIFVETMIRVLPDLPGATALLIGRVKGKDQGFVDQLKARIAEAGLSDRILFTGEVPTPEMPGLIRALSLLMAVPRYEPFGVTPSEGMASGVPIVVSDTGHFAAFAGDGEAGRLVPTGDVEATVAAVKAVLAEGAPRAQAARARAVEHFNLTGEAAAIEGVYEELWAKG
ncbi:glycosyltransferase family 4 protein [Acidimangrovimonas sediminis]|uniref:glycosyltransferase family 4 protein n=1 Tax=Acidimangrovimonas sediminis TaxID=2056283 RepID=UPI000C808AAC|nr:glycosyltransferase family 4 protein [Acidimangrovimonas sediminis]